MHASIIAPWHPNSLGPSLDACVGAVAKREREREIDSFFNA